VRELLTKSVCFVFLGGMFQPTIVPPSIWLAKHCILATKSNHYSLFTFACPNQLHNIWASNKIHTQFKEIFGCHFLGLRKWVGLLSGREKELQHDKEQAQAVYKHVQGEVERGLEYLLVRSLISPYI